MTKRPNIVLITSDQQRYDSLGVTGAGGDAHTPHLDRMGREGLLFRNHFVTNPVCSPSRASFMTGLYPCENGLWSNGCALPEDCPTLASTLSDSGYQTAHVGKLHLVPILDRIGQHPAYGFEHLEVGEGDQNFMCDDHMNAMRQRDPLGFVSYLGEVYRGGQSEGYTSDLPEPLHHSTWVTDRSLKWLGDRQDDRPFFLNVGYFDPHHAFNPIEPWASRFADHEPAPPLADPESWHLRPPHYRDAIANASKVLTERGRRDRIANAYFAMISHIDHCVGRLLSGLQAAGVADDTIVVFTSDHGEFLGHQGMLHKGAFLLDDLMRVPMIAKVPNGQPAVVDGLTSMIDLMTTFTAIADHSCPTPHGLPMFDDQGRSHPQGSHDAVFAQWESQSDGPESSQRMIRTQTHKLIAYDDPSVGELYDLAQDPHEFRNRFDDPELKAVKAALLGKLEAQLMQKRPDSPCIQGW